MDFVEFNAPSHPALNALSVSINNQAKAAKVPPCALAAIVAVETGGRNVLQEGMRPGPGCGVGLCQITSGVDWTDLAHPTYQAEGQSWELLDPSSNLFVAAKYFLAPAIAEIDHDRQRHQNAYARFSGEILYFAFAAYNAGAGTVFDSIRAGHDPDSYTTNHYAARAFNLYHEFLRESHDHAKTA
jgi:hypothetical protein